LRADLVIVDTQTKWKVEPEKFKSRGKCSPFAGRDLRGKILMTINAGKIVFGGGIYV
jgi:dihydroorotase